MSFVIWDYLCLRIRAFVENIASPYQKAYCQVGVYKTRGYMYCGKTTYCNFLNTIQLSFYKQMPNVVMHNIKHFPLMNSEYLVFAIVVKHVVINFNLLNTLVLQIEHFDKIIKRAQCIIICIHLDI